MQTSRSSSHAAIALGFSALALLSSCSLPPSVAWRQIQQDGLINFMSNGMSAPKATTPGQISDSSSGAMLASTSRSSTKVIEPPKPPLQAGSSSFATAYAVKNLTGYVRTPYTNPPRLVDVRGMGAGSKVVCPYTQKPFVVPESAVAPGTPTKTMLASAPSKARPTTPPPVVKPQEKAAPSAIAASKPQSTPARTTPAPKPAPEPIKSEPPAVVKTQPKKEPAAPSIAANTAPKVEPKKEESTPVPPPAAAAAPKLPYGAPIPGRPGFVNSPYADKHQLVDVTGLSVGTEVKCPYTGKLFRVPPQAQAKR